MTRPTTYLHYVVWDRIADYERIGWMIVASHAAYHAQWGVIMEWRCGCRCVVPT